jgi:hypothetical protein
MSETDENILLEETEETENIQKKTQRGSAPARQKETIPITKKKLVIKTQPKPVSDEEEEVITSKPVSRAGAKPRIVSDDEEEEEIMTPKKAPAKKERTEAQKLAFEKCKQQRELNAKKRADDAKKLMEYEKKALEEKLIAKAVSLKKKQIKKQVVLDEISDDETPIEKVKEMAKKIKPVEKPKSLFTFI